MKHIALIAAAWLFSSVTSAQAQTNHTATYALDPMHTSVGWQINHFGFSNPSGKFAMVQGTLILNDFVPANSSVNATIAMANLVTGISKLDEHLRSKDFFDAEHFPTAAFVSNKVETTSTNTAKVYGTLTLRGISRPVVLDVKLNKIGENMMKKKTAGFSATTTIRRSDFGMNAFLPMLGDEVKLTIESEANLTQGR